jgi:hypothetical protein
MTNRTSARAARLVAGIAAVGLTIIAGGCHRGVTSPDHTTGHPVLFIGNSLTYVNDLPGIVRKLGEISGDSVDAWTLADPDVALVDFVANGRGPATILSYQWEYVVMQQGPSTVDVNRDTLIIGAQALDQYVKQIGARSARRTSTRAGTRTARRRRPWEAFSCPPARRGARCGRRMPRCSSTAATGTIPRRWAAGWPRSRSSSASPGTTCARCRRRSCSPMVRS